MTKPVCETCNDTHRMLMTSIEREVMCTACPVPCGKCREGGRGAYCEQTPCACDCHEPKEKRVTKPVPNERELLAYLLREDTSAADCYANLADYVAAHEAAAYQRAIADVCAWLRNDGLADEGLQQTANGIEQHFGKGRG